MPTPPFDPAELADSARRAIEACTGLDLAATAARLAEDGLLGVMAPEAAGGMGLGIRFAVPVMQAAGLELLKFPLLETQLMAAALPETGPAIAAGELVATVAWAGMARLRDGRLTGTVGRAPCAAGCGAVLVRVNGGGAALVRTNAAGVTVSAAPTLDLECPEYEVTLEDAAATELIDQVGTERLEQDAHVLRAGGDTGRGGSLLGPGDRACVDPAAIRPAAGELPGPAACVGTAKTGDREHAGGPDALGGYRL